MSGRTTRPVHEEVSEEIGDLIEAIVHDGADPRMVWNLIAATQRFTHLRLLEYLVQAPKDAPAPSHPAPQPLRSVPSL